MPVPNEITFTDMSHLFLTAECNGQGTRHVIDGALIRVMPCTCPKCESTKPEREQAYIAFENRLVAAKRALAENSRKEGRTV